MSQLEIENDKARIQLGECQWQKDKTEENLDKISEAVDLTINKCKVTCIFFHWFSLNYISLIQHLKIHRKLLKVKKRQLIHFRLNLTFTNHQ